MKIEVLREGCLAYLDFLVGLVPCKVVEITKPKHPLLFDLELNGVSSSTTVVTVVTKDKSPYKKGETIHTTADRVVPRKAVRKGKFTNYVNHYQVEEGKDQ